jgi:hypothetical protein
MPHTPFACCSSNESHFAIKTVHIVLPPLKIYRPQDMISLQHIERDLTKITGTRSHCEMTDHPTLWKNDLL